MKPIKTPSLLPGQRYVEHVLSDGSIVDTLSTAPNPTDTTSQNETETPKSTSEPIVSFALGQTIPTRARSFFCLCGHRLIEHALCRDPTPSAPRIYQWYRCLHDSCRCERAHNETGTIQ